MIAPLLLLFLLVLPFLSSAQQVSGTSAVTCPEGTLPYTKTEYWPKSQLNFTHQLPFNIPDEAMEKPFAIDIGGVSAFGSSVKGQNNDYVSFTLENEELKTEWIANNAIEVQNDTESIKCIEKHRMLVFANPGKMNPFTFYNKTYEIMIYVPKRFSNVTYIGSSANRLGAFFIDSNYFLFSQISVTFMAVFYNLF